MSFRNRKSSVMPFPDRVFQGRALKKSFAREDHIYLETVCDVSPTISGTAKLNRRHTKMVFKKVYTGSIQIGWMSPCVFDIAEKSTFDELAGHIYLSENIPVLCSLLAMVKRDIGCPFFFTRYLIISSTVCSFTSMG
ncbi:hypothetical protein TNIN_456321 [Trichonephila inaurata madagascariensis]|uniref:Uncharacterized protein n=1 Tax=Trichonephila inaurata madagascariensis TaxID=2747483 RepID=A0A8X7BU65_9ARAC|nr:hypothetical protein TNIN_456321 [Trichonephila inaurata madagascariensis]